jgi:hypothetical protein
VGVGVERTLAGAHAERERDMARIRRRMRFISRYYLKKERDDPEAVPTPEGIKFSS